MGWNLPEEKRRRKPITVCVNELEMESILQYFKKSNCTSLSEYVREKALGHTINIKYRNATIDDLLKEMVPLKEGLTQLVQDIRDAGNKWEPNEKTALLKKVDDILIKLIEYYNICLSKPA